MSREVARIRCHCGREHEIIASFGDSGWYECECGCTWTYNYVISVYPEPNIRLLKVRNCNSKLESRNELTFAPNNFLGTRVLMHYPNGEVEENYV